MGRLVWDGSVDVATTDPTSRNRSRHSGIVISNATAKKWDDGTRKTGPKPKT